MRIRDTVDEDGRHGPAELQAPDATEQGLDLLLLAAEPILVLRGVRPPHLDPRFAESRLEKPDQQVLLRGCDFELHGATPGTSADLSRARGRPRSRARANRATGHGVEMGEPASDRVHVRNTEARDFPQ